MATQTAMPSFGLGGGEELGTKLRASDRTHLMGLCVGRGAAEYIASGPDDAFQHHRPYLPLHGSENDFVPVRHSTQRPKEKSFPERSREAEADA
ncbi:hypothetical protein NEUTE2DRAFT_132557 [Neurospora tetrasperma FGSC 2509]|nr:hypothetical protein NEUTE2DRAFT_132557 [Neurospora tetrasperma FGSC 2509]